MAAAPMKSAARTSARTERRRACSCTAPSAGSAASSTLQSLPLLPALPRRRRLDSRTSNAAISSSARVVMATMRGDGHAAVPPTTISRAIRIASAWPSAAAPLCGRRAIASAASTSGDAHPGIPPRRRQSARAATAVRGSVAKAWWSPSRRSAHTRTGAPRFTLSPAPSESPHASLSSASTSPSPSPSVGVPAPKPAASPPPPPREPTAAEVGDLGAASPPSPASPLPSASARESRLSKWRTGATDSCTAIGALSSSAPQSEATIASACVATALAAASPSSSRSPAAR